MIAYLTMNFNVTGWKQEDQWGGSLRILRQVRSYLFVFF